MGKLMLYGAGRACQIASSKGTDSGVTYATIHAYKDTSGNTYNTIGNSSGSNYSGTTCNNIQYLKDLTGHISADTLADFTLDDYNANALSDIGYTRTMATNTNGVIYTITATNNGASAVTVGSIKFAKNVYYKSNSSNVCSCLIAGYFLDTPVTIEAGATKTFAVNIDCWNY